MRGSERAFAQVASRWPEAPIFTTLCRPEGIDPRLRARKVVTSFLQKTGARQSNFRWLLPLFPKAVDVVFVGRLARYQYLNMDQVVGQALATFSVMSAQDRQPLTAAPA